MRFATLAWSFLSLTSWRVRCRIHLAHPYASKLFVNWFLSKEGQTLMHTKSARTPDQTFREDVTEMGKVNPAEIRRPDVDYMNFSHNPKVLGRQSWALKNAAKLYRQIRHN